MDQTSSPFRVRSTPFGVVDRYRIQLALVPFVETRRRLTRQPSGACSGRCWSRRPPLVVIVLGELLRVLLHLTVGCPSIAGGVILLFQAVWMVLATR